MSEPTVHDAALTMDLAAFLLWIDARVTPAMRLDWERRGVAQETQDRTARRAWERIREKATRDEG
jgi:hypothetical protein